MIMSEAAIIQALAQTGATGVLAIVVVWVFRQGEAREARSAAERVESDRRAAAREERLITLIERYLQSMSEDMTTIKSYIIEQHDTGPLSKRRGGGQ